MTRGAALGGADDPRDGAAPEPGPALPATGDRHERGTAGQLEHDRQHDEQPGNTDDEPGHGERAEPDRAERGERGVLELGGRQRDIATVTGSADRERGTRRGPDRSVARVP